MELASILILIVVNTKENTVNEEDKTPV